MAVVPKARDKLLTFFQMRVDTWLADPGSIGLEAQQAADVAAAFEALAEAEREARDLKRRAMGAVMLAGVRDEELRRLGGAAINSIRAYAQATDDADTLVRASLPAVRRRSPRPAPQTPVNVRPRLASNGAIKVTWEGSVAHGTTYSVWRTVEGGPGATMPGPAEYIGTVGDTTIIDYLVPPRILGAMYTVQAIRGRKRSPMSAAGTLRFTRATEALRTRAAA